MFANDFATVQKSRRDPGNGRRGKARFPIRRELRYKLTKSGVTAEVGTSETVDIGSGGVSFAMEHELPVGSIIELSISWPVLLEQNTPMRLNVFGRVVRNEPGKCACTVERYEFRTQARSFQPTVVRQNIGLQRWADTVVRNAVPLLRAERSTSSVG
jgi:hypothetical protein